MLAMDCSRGTTAPLDPFEMGRGNRSKILHHVHRFPRSAFVLVEKGEEREAAVLPL